MSIFDQKIKKYSKLNQKYWSVKIINFFSIVSLLLLFILSITYKKANLADNNDKIEKNLIGLWHFNSNTKKWELLPLSFYVIIVSNVVLFLQIVVIFCFYDQSNFSKIYFPSNMLLMLLLLFTILISLIINPNWINHQPGFWWKNDEDDIVFNSNGISYCFCWIILFVLINVLYFLDIILNLILQKKYNIFIMNKNYKNQNYRQNW